MKPGRANSRPGRSVAMLVLVGLAAACGSSDPEVVASGDGDPELRSVPLATAGELHRVFGADRSDPTVASVEGGALILGGAVVEDGDAIRQEIRPVGDAFWVDAEGQVTDVGPLPTSEPLGDVAVSVSNGSVFVAGVTCRVGSTPSDVGELNCEPGEPELLRFDSSDLVWEQIDPPGDAPPPADTVGAVTVHGFDDGLAYSVLEDLDGPMRTWVTTDEQVWSEISIPDRSGLCATDGALLAIDDSDLGSPTDDGPVTIEPPLTPDTTLTLQLRRFDVESGSWSDVDPVEDPGIEIVRGGTIATCTAEAGYVTLNMTGDRSEALVVFRADGRVQEVDAFDGLRVGSITPTSGTLVLVHAEDGVVAVDTLTGETRSVEQPEGSRVVGSVGQEAVLVVTDRLKMVDL